VVLRIVASSRINLTRDILSSAVNSTTKGPLHRVELVIREIPQQHDDDALARLSRDQPEWSFELDSDGSLIVSPTHTEGGTRDVEAAIQLAAFAKTHGGKTFGSSTGFRMPDLSVRSPDASWISSERIARLTPEERTKYWRVCPEIVIEVLSDSDSWATLLRKLDMYARNGARFVVGIDPFARLVETCGVAPDGLRLDYDAIMEA